MQDLLKKLKDRATQEHDYHNGECKRLQGMLRAIFDYEAGPSSNGTPLVPNNTETMAAAMDSVAPLETVRPPRKAGRPKGTKTNAILKIVRRSPGLTGIQIADKLIKERPDASRNSVSAILCQKRAKGVLKRSGNKYYYKG